MCSVLSYHYRHNHHPPRCFEQLDNMTFHYYYHIYVVIYIFVRWIRDKQIRGVRYCIGSSLPFSSKEKVFMYLLLCGYFFEDGYRSLNTDTYQIWSIGEYSLSFEYYLPNFVHSTEQKRPTDRKCVPIDHIWQYTNIISIS